MRPTFHFGLTAATIAAVVVFLAATPFGAVDAQTPLRMAQAEDAQPKQVALTQTQIDGVLAAQKALHAVEEQYPQSGTDQPDPKLEAKLDGIAKKNGFSGLGEYADVSSSIGVVMAGIDPETKTYVGPGVVIKKQIAEVTADKTMPPKEKKEALDELKAAMSSASSAQPLPGNIDLVTKNFDKLAQSMQQGAGGD